MLYSMTAQRFPCLRRGIVLAVLVLLLLPATAFAQTTFANVTDDFPNLTLRAWGGSWIDYNSDGLLDLFLGHFGLGDGHVLLRNTGTGFERVAVAAFAEGPVMIGHTWGDYDNDGDPDLLAAGNSTVLYRNDGNDLFTMVTTGVIGEQAANRGWAAAWGDYDNDGHLDLVVAYPVGFVDGPPIPNQLLHNTGDGTFERVTDGPVVEGLDTYTIPSWADYDLDGDLDLFIGSGPASGGVDPDHLYRNRLAETGTASFERITGLNIADDPRDGQVMNWIDYDNGGDLDLFVTNYLGTNDPNFISLPPDLYRNEGDGTFTRITDSPLTQRANGNDLANVWGDLDNDGDLDVIIATARVVAGPGIGEQRIFFNNGDGTFEVGGRLTGLLRETTSSGASLGDYDNDGDLDAVITSVSPGIPENLVYRNNLSNGNGWIKLRLEGTMSNRSAIGAVVRVTAQIGGQTIRQLRQVSAQNSFGGQNSLIVHFGLGDAARIEELVISWPSGQETRVERVLPNQTVTVVEGEPFGGVVVGTAAPVPLPERFALHANYPNPFNPTTTLMVDLPVRAEVHVVVYDVLGRRVLALPPQGMEAGREHTIALDASALGSGVYLYHVTATTGQGMTTRTGHFTLLK